MGYVVLHLDKSPGNETPMSAHIERTIIPPNCNPKLTHLNRELIEFPDNVHNRTEAIQHRLDTADLTRKIGKNQVQVVRIMLTGSQEEMKLIVSEGKLDNWCADNLEWLRKTYDEKNMVSAVLHLDETSPHIHATMIPIVTGERRKAKVEEQSGKKKYRKKSTDNARLCADDVMSRAKLKEYQDTYAEAMSKYGLQRGVDGSEARHITSSQWYRELFVQNESLEENIGRLLQQQEQAKQELSKAKSDISKEKFKNSAADVGTSIVDGIGSVLGTSKVNKQQREINSLKAENAELKESLGSEIKQLKERLRTTEAEHAKITDKLRQELKKVYELFPHIRDLLRWEEFLKKVGFTEELIKRLFNREEVKGSGNLYSSEHNKNFKAENAAIKLEQDQTEPSKIRLTINGTDILDWFRQKQSEFLQSLGINPKQNNINQHKMQ
ncbi:MAG: MobV family relaxase [Candidatus Paceibacterota bacterium]|jgi:hypothetical protein